MAFLAGTGSEIDPFQIETLENWNTDLWTVPGGSYAILMQNLDFTGVPAHRTGNVTIDFNGFKIENIPSFVNEGSPNNYIFRGTTIKNGEVNCNAVGSFSDFYSVIHSATNVLDMKFTGSLTNNGTGDASLMLNFYTGYDYKNIMNQMDFYGNGIVAGMSHATALQNPALCRNIIFTGTVNDAGSGTSTLYAFGTNTAGGDYTNMFFDSDKVGGTATTNDGSLATAKTTAELKNIDTYTNLATVGLDTVYDMVDVSVYNGEEWAIDNLNAYPILAFEYVPVVTASGTVKFNDVNFSNGVVDFFSVPSPTGTSDKVDSDVPITNGVATMTTERDPLKDYFGIARGMTQDFTGTLASAPSGDVISTGLNLTGISIGGVNDDHYIFRATAGAGAGEEVTVIDRDGGDIIVTDASAFATGTEFTLGRFVRGVSRVFPKD